MSKFTRRGLFRRLAAAPLAAVAAVGVAKTVPFAHKLAFWHLPIAGNNSGRFCHLVSTPWHPENLTIPDFMGPLTTPDPDFCGPPQPIGLLAEKVLQDCKDDWERAWNNV